MKEQNRLATLVNSKYYPLLLFFVSFVFVTLFSRSTSFLYLFEGSDPSVFKQMGRAILKGKTLYIDYFDNKGCLLYFIHALGLWMGGNFFLLLMQTLSLTATLVIWDKMLALYRNQSQRLICLGIALFLLLCFYGAGDQTQEWCLPFISYPLLAYFRAYKTKTDIRPLQMLVIGLCFGIISFIQINNACAFLGFIAYLWIQYLMKKDFGKLLQSVGCFIVGWIIVAIPCLLYFYVQAGWHGIYEMTYASLLSNFEYLNNQWRTRPVHILIYAILLLTFITFTIIIAYRKKEIVIPIILSFLLFVGTFGRLCNSFYFLALLPLYIVLMMIIDGSKNRRVLKILSGITLVCLMFYAGNTMKDLLFQNSKEKNNYGNFHHCINNIPENERDSIYNYNLYWHGTHMMEHEGLLQCNRVLFTSLVFTLPTLWKEETSKPINPPKWILVSFEKQIKKGDTFFIIDNYDLCCSFLYDNLYLQKPRIGETFEIRLYRRKDTTPSPEEATAN